MNSLNKCVYYGYLSFCVISHCCSLILRCFYPHLWKVKTTQKIYVFGFALLFVLLVPFFQGETVELKDNYLITRLINIVWA